MSEFAPDFILLKGILRDEIEIASLVGPHWGEFKANLLGVLEGFEGVRDEEVSPRIERLVELGMNSPASDVFSKIVDEAKVVARVAEDAEDLEGTVRDLKDRVSSRLVPRRSLEWAMLHVDLGDAYLRRIHGTPEENVETAMRHLKQALRGISSDVAPAAWAKCQNLLGVAYAVRSRGKRAENVEAAIEFLEGARRTRETATPVELSQTLQSLGDVYRQRVKGDRAANLETAIGCFRNVLDITATVHAPNLRSDAWNGLGIALTNLPTGDQRENLRDARDCFLRAFEAGAQGAPLRRVQASRNLVQVDRRLGREGVEPETLLDVNVPRISFAVESLHLVNDPELPTEQRSDALRLQYAALAPTVSWRVAGDAERVNLVRNVALELAETLKNKRPARYVNFCITRQDRSVLPRDHRLATNRRYLFRIDVGSLSSESVVRNAMSNPFPDEVLPDTGKGHWLSVIAVSDDVRVGDLMKTVFLPRDGAGWLCDCAPESEHRCAVDQRSPFLFISVTTSERAGPITARIAIYHRNNLIQSQLIRALVGPDETEDGEYYSEIDYSLSAWLGDLEDLPARSLSVLTNENIDGTHRIVVNGGDAEPVTFRLTEGQMRGAVTRVRDILKAIHIEEYGGHAGTKKQFRNRYDGDNAKGKAEFTEDLQSLALVGWQLRNALLQNQPEGQKRIEKALSSNGSIQVSRPRGSAFVFPWSLVYDIPIETGAREKNKLCRLVDDWRPPGTLLKTGSEQCPYQSTHRRNVVCPFGFWGFKHTIEQPPSVPLGRSISTRVRAGNRPAVVMVGYSTELDGTLAKKHLTLIKSQLSRFHVNVLDTRDGIETALGQDELELVYLYCHGKGRTAAGSAGGETDLVVGAGETIAADDLNTWASDWSDGHWAQTPPLVVLNGCHTAELTPELLTNFVDAFALLYAAGTIGTEITIHQQVAGEAAERFMNYYLDEKSVGEAMRQMRLDFLTKGNLLGLAYTAYCSAKLNLEKIP